jgi:outer membrane protein assembly factor BamA
LIKVVLSKAINADLVAEAGLNYYSNNISAVSQGSNPIDQALIDRSRSYLFATTAIKMDRTDNYLSPRKGESAYFTLDLASGWSRAQIDLEKFSTPLHPDQVLAARLLFTEVAGSDVPVYEYATLGGRDTLRGYSLYRFRGGAAALANLEYRFPLFGQLSGVAFLDTGKVFSNLGSIDLAGWPGDYGLGLRYLLGSLILRLDYGIGQEERNLYFYYNHVF